MKNKHERIYKDVYPTQDGLANWGVQKAVELHGDKKGPLNIFEPGCGNTAPFLRTGMTTVCNKGFGLDFRDVNTKQLEKEIPNLKIMSKVDFLKMSRAEVLKEAKVRSGFDLIITNPPYAVAEEFIWKSLEVLSPTGILGMLLKIDFLGSSSRAALYAMRPPIEVCVSQKRPSFVYGKTDMHNYGFFYWAGDRLTQILKDRGLSSTRISWFSGSQWEGAREEDFSK